MPDDAGLDRIVLALLFASDEPLAAKRISQLLETTQSEVKESLERLREKFESENSCIKLEQVALGYQLATRPEFSAYIARLYSSKRRQRLSKAGLETLAIISYKQPITRAEIENIRGVSCGGVITTLMERSLIRIVGKAKVLGAPFLYGTTREFLEYLGLNSLDDLPTLEELEELLEREEYREEDSEVEQREPAADARQPSSSAEAASAPHPGEIAGHPPESLEFDGAERAEEIHENADERKSGTDEVSP